MIPASAASIGPRQPRVVLRGKGAGRAQHLAYHGERLRAGVHLCGKHRRNGRERGILIDVQHIELLPHQRLERGETEVGMRGRLTRYPLDARGGD
jgi:hypothetical protein